MAELDGIWFAAVLATNTNLEIFLRGTTTLNADLHQLANTSEIDDLERILLHHFQFLILIDEAAIVIAAHSQTRLGKVIGTEREELGGFSNLGSSHRCPRKLDHGANEVLDGDALLLENSLRGSMNHCCLKVKFLLEAHQRNHDFRVNLNTFLLHNACCFKNSTGLHLGNFREHNAQAASTETEHGVEFMQRLHAALDFLD